MLRLVRLPAVFCLFLVCSQGFANYWDVKMCSWGVNGNAVRMPGETFNVSWSVSAQRDATSTIPVSIYFGLSATHGGGDTLIGSGYATVYSPGSFCSSTVTTSVTLPYATNGSCFAAGTGYIHYVAGSDVKTDAIQVGPAPTISSFSPTDGFPGDVITVTGTGFDAATTGVFFNGVQAAVGVTSSTSLVAVVPDGASTGKITVRAGTANWIYCLPPAGTSAANFSVLPAHCASGAAYSGYGNITYFSPASSEFAYNVIGGPSCASYTDNGTDYVADAVQGASKQFYVQFGTCGSASYARMFKMYADWNRDGDFADPGEYLVEAPSVAADTLYSVTITVPSGASLGSTRLRLVSALYYTGVVDTVNDVGPCTVYPFGETQDYGLVVASSFAKQADETPDDLLEDAIPLIANPRTGAVPIGDAWLDLGPLEDLDPDTY